MGHNEMLIREALEGAARQRRSLSVKFGALREPAAASAAIDAPPGGGEELPRLQPAPARHRLHRHLPPRARRSRRADRGHRRRDRRHGEGGLCAPHRPVRDRRGHHPARARGASDRRPADRILAVLRGIEAEILPDPARARHRHHRLRRAVARPVQRPLDQGPQRGASDFRGHCRASAATTSIATSRWSTRCARIADAKGVSVAQLAIAWVLSRGADIVPLVGARKRERLAEALGALDVTFSADELKRIEAAVPLGAAAGDRYDK